MSCRTVLLIEDSTTQRAAIEDILERGGYSVASVAGGHEGLQVLRESSPDIVLLDVVMPGLDGWRVLELIRSASAVPVVMLTVRDSEPERVRGLHGGADDYIGKPFGSAELAARIEAVLRRTSAARRDALTGLANYLTFHEHLDWLFRRTQDQEFALVLFDLDDFKLINDVEGHPVGDEVLRDVARVVLRQLRVGEEAFRIGGEEFAIIVEGSREGGLRVAERIRRALTGQLRGRRLPTMSAGVAGFPLDALMKDELVRRADAALYVAKNSGKNKVMSHEEGAAVLPSSS